MAPPKRKAAEAANAALVIEGGAPLKKKSKLGIAPKKFLEAAPTLKVTLEGVEEGPKEIELKPKKFSTSSLGFSGVTKVKILVDIDGETKELTAQATFNVTVQRSKESEDTKGEDGE